MVVTDSLPSPPHRVQIKEEPESDTDTVDTQTDLSSPSPSSSSCSPSPVPSVPNSPRQAPLPMDTVILVAKCPDGTKNSLVFRSLLRTRKAPGRVEKIRIVKTKSPVTEFKHASMPMRANLKQQLQRQQLLEQEKREQAQSHINTVHVTGSAGISVPRVVESAEVPTNVLRVKTQLQHPTKYHVRQSQRRQVADFLNEHQGDHLPIQSLPANVVSVSAPEQHQHYITASTSAPEPDLPSPLLGSAGTEFLTSDFDFLGDLQPVELSGLLEDSDLVEIKPSLGTTELQHSGFLQGLDGAEADAGLAAGGANSVPTTHFRRHDVSQTGIMSVQDEMWRKERIKKDNHNMIERRRRFNINDRIKELGGLLPKSIDPESRQNKGSILKASVDYIRNLQEDQRQYKIAVEQKRKAESDLRKLLLKMNQMNILMQSHGIQNPLMEDLQLSTNITPNFLTNVVPSSLPSSSSNSIYTGMSSMDELMDESSPVSGDPMLLSTPGSPDHESAFDGLDPFHS